jgi:hypothetical protein
LPTSLAIQRSPTSKWRPHRSTDRQLLCARGRLLHEAHLRLCVPARDRHGQQRAPGRPQRLHPDVRPQAPRLLG